MKSAEEFLSKIIAKPLGDIVQSIKARDLKMWKQGMTDAAKIVNASQSGSVMDTRTAIEDIYLKRDDTKSV